MIGPQVSAQQLAKVSSYVDIGRAEGAEVLRGRPAEIGGEFADGYCYQPTVLKGHNKMRVFQEEDLRPGARGDHLHATRPRPSRSPTTRCTGSARASWTRDGSRAYRVGRAIKAGRVWTNCYHQYPAGAAFGGYRISGIGRETHKMMLEHYSQTKNLLVSYDTKLLGLF